MSEIRPFPALIPNREWLEDLPGATDSAGGTDRFQQLKMLLEPRAESLSDNRDLSGHLRGLNDLIAKGSYCSTAHNGFYIYERESDFGSQTGIWALTSLDDLKNGKIITHEHTLSEHEARLKKYREDVGIEGTPVLLTYRREPRLSALIERKVLHKPDLACFYKGSLHRIWMVSDEQSISEFQEIFKDIPSVYVADGHHRLAAAAAMQESAPQWITTLYVTAGQLRCREFHKMVVPHQLIPKDQLIQALGRHFHIAEAANNAPIRPENKGTFGLRHEGRWYRLKLKERPEANNALPDVSFLQSEVLEPLFGIEDPRKDSRLTSWHPEQWDDMLSFCSANPGSVLFTLYPMSTGELIEQAEMQAILPPKSTYIEPKMPFGLLLYSHNYHKINQEGVACHA
jgi:uncharacterized protein (DUF1015 family)